MSKKQTARKAGINAIDIVIVLAVVLVVASIMVRYFNVKQNYSESDYSDATISFVIRKVDNSVSYKLRDGEKLRLAAGGGHIGTFSGNLTEAPSKVYALDGTSQISVDSSLYKDIFGNMRVSGVMSERGFMIRGALYVAPGQMLALISDTSDLTVEILDIEID